MSTPLWQPRSDTAARLLGLGFAAAGTAILYWQIIVTLKRAVDGDATISYSLKLIALGEMFAVLGVFWLATGLRGYTRVVGLQKDRRFMWGLGAVALVAIALTQYFLSRELAAHGFQ